MFSAQEKSIVVSGIESGRLSLPLLLHESTGKGTAEGMKKLKPPHPLILFVALNVLFIVEVVFLNFHYAMDVPNSAVFLLAFVILAANLLYYRFFMKTIHMLEEEMELLRRKKETEVLLKPYEELAAQQLRLREEVHDILNAQFTYHSLENAGEHEKAEAYRGPKLREWREYEEVTHA